MISGNAGEGIEIDGSALNRIEGNYIGTDFEAKTDVGNAGNGILLMNRARFHWIGGTDALPVPPPEGYSGKPSQGNVISGKDGNGVLLAGGTHRTCWPAILSAPTSPATRTWETRWTASPS